MLEIRSLTANIFEAIENNREEYFQPAPASVATADLPGSWGKIDTLASRVEAGEELWHPQDVVCYVASVEKLAVALHKIKIATGLNRTSEEFVARRAKMNLQSA